MRKNQINYSVFLYIGLLIFSTFFSCTNTRQEMNQNKAEKGLLKKVTTRPTATNMSRSYNRNYKKIILGVAIGLSLLGAGATSAYVFSNIPPEGPNVPTLNSPNFTTTSPNALNLSMTEAFNSIGSHSNASTGSALAYSSHAPSSTTFPNKNTSNRSINKNDNLSFDLLYNRIFHDLNDLNDLQSLINSPGININVKDEDGNTIFYHVAFMRNTEKFALLLKHPDVLVNAQNNFGDAPIHMAAYLCHLPIIELLIKDQRVDLTIRNNGGITALDIAKKSHHSECIILLENGMKKRSHQKKSQNLFIKFNEYSGPKN